MRTVSRSILLLSLISAIAGCDTSSNVEFKDGRANLNRALPVAKQLAVTSGGQFRRTTASGYKVDFSLNAPVNFVQRTTASGAKAQLNISAQSAE